MLVFNGDQKFESFYLKHFENFVDLQNCTECFKNLSIYSQSIYYQSLQDDTGSFKRILTENDSWLDDNFWKNGGNMMKNPSSIGTLNSNPLSFIISGSEKMLLTNDGFGINMSPSYSLDVNGTVRIYQNSLYVTSVGSVGGIIDYTRYLSVNGSTGTNGQFLKRIFNGNSWSNILISDVSGLGTYTSSMNTWTGSVSSSLNSLNNYTSSNNTSLTGLNSFSSSIKSYTSSLNTWTGSVVNNLNSLNSLTSSYYTQGGNSFGQSGSIGTIDNNNLHIITSGSTRIFVSSSGAIGFGTLTPVSSYLITANGNTLISNGRFGTSVLGINIFNYSGVTPRIASDGNLDYLATNTHRWYRSGDLHMMSLGSTGLRISSTFSTASYSLDVQGTIGLSGILYVGNTSYGLPLSSGSDGQFLKRSNYLGSFVLNTWDNILTSDVTGLNSFTSSVNTSLTSLNSLTGSYFKQGGNSFGTTATLGTIDNNQLNFITSGSVRMITTNTGNVLIGTSTDNGYKLNVNGSINTNSSISRNGESILWGNAGDSYANIRVLQNASTTLQDGMYINYSSTGTLGAHLRFFANGTTERMRIDASTGNVGIGTTIPYSKLQITNPGAIGSHLRFDTGANSGYDFNLDSNSYLRLTYILTGSTYKELVTFAYNGNIGIGTTNPLSKLDSRGDIHVSDGSGIKTRYRTGGIIDFTNFAESAYANANITANTLTLAGNNGAGIYINNVGNVGIGTTSPSYKLDIQGSGIITQRIVSTDNQANFSLQGTLGQFSNEVGDFYINNNSVSGNMIFRVGNTTERMRINSSGNVGIGTATPTEKLTVYKGNYSALNVLSDTQSSLLLNTTTLNGVNNPNVELYNSYGNVGLVLYPTPTSTYNNILYYDNTNKETQFQTNGSTKLTIKSNGNVLIGSTTDSGYKLDVNGTTRSSNFLTSGYLSTSNSNVLIFTNNGSQDIWSQGTSGTIRFVDSSYANVNFQVSQNGNGYFRGNVGIGTTSPSQKLQVAGYGKFDSGIIGSSAGLAIYGSESSSNGVFLTTAGNFGIGTTNPATILHAATVSQQNLISVESSNATPMLAGITKFGQNNRSGFNYRGEFQLLLQSFNGTSYYDNEVLTAKHDGKIGIGTTSPTNVLSVVGGTAITNGWTRTMSLQSTFPVMIFNSTAVSKYAGIGYDGTTNMNFWVNGSSEDVSGTGIIAMSIKSSNGNVGIGTSSPVTPLHIYLSATTAQPIARFETFGTNSRPYIDFKAESSDLGYMGWGSTGSNVMYIWSYLNSDIRLGTSNTTRVTINGSGNILIGTTTDAGDKLQVNGNINISNSFALRFGGGFQYISNNSTTSTINFGSNGATNMSITNGNVGIGTTTDAGYKLDVSGSIRATGNIDINGGNTTVAGTITANSSGGGLYFGANGTNQNIRFVPSGTGYNFFVNTAYFQGNIGIGTTTPNAPLQFANTTANRKIVLYEGVNTDHHFYGFGINPNTLRYQVNLTTDAHTFYAGTSPTTSNQLFSIKGNGTISHQNLTTTQINAITGMTAGDMAYNSDLTMFVYYNGTGWKRLHDNSNM